MTDFPATGQWSIYSVQKTLPGLGKLGTLLGAHNYLALVDPLGNITQEMQGVYTDHFTVNGGDRGNYLAIQMWKPNQYMSTQSIVSAKQVMIGSQAAIQAEFNSAFDTVAAALGKTHDLYDGAEIIGNAYNSNSVWYTAMKALGVSDPSAYSGPANTPGDKTDLTTAPTNNKYFGGPEDLYPGNPGHGTNFYYNQNPGGDNSKSGSVQDPSAGFAVVEHNPDSGMVQVFTGAPNSADLRPAAITVESGANSPPPDVKFSTADAIAPVITLAISHVLTGSISRDVSINTENDTFIVDPNLAPVTKLMLNGGNGNNQFSVGGGTETLIGGSGSNTFKIDASAKGSANDVIWGGGGTSTYYVNGSPTVYVYYMSDPTAAKIAALTPDMINSEYQISPVPLGTAHLEQQDSTDGNAIYIIDPGPNDRIYNDGVLLTDFANRISADAQSAWTSYPYPWSSGISNYLYFNNPPSIGAPGPDTVQSLPTGGSVSGFQPGLTLVNFAIGDFGITYSGPVASDSTPSPIFSGWQPDQGFLDWNTKFKLNVQTSDENGDQLNSDNGSIMAGSGAVTYGIAADTPSSLISSQDGSQVAVVNFLGSSTPSTLDITGGGGSDGLGLVLQDRATGQTVTVLDGLGASATRVASIAFSDGETLSYSSILQALTTGSATQTKLYGDGDANVIDSHGYANYAQGNGGGDTFAYSVGYGHLEISELDYSYNADNVLRFGPGVTASQLTARADESGNLYVSDGTPGDQIELDGQLNDPIEGGSHGVQIVTFSDGSTMTSTQLIALVSNINSVTGTTDADNLQGSCANETFDGKGAPVGSSDYIFGGGGNDTIIYDRGYGQLQVMEFDLGPNPNNVLQFGPGITASDLTVTSDADNTLYVSDGTPGDLIQLEYAKINPPYGFQTIQFSDGTSMTGAQLTALSSVGSTGADDIYGTFGSDVLDGKGAPAGSQDHVTGYGGGDIYVFNQGYGALVIDNATLGATYPLGEIDLGSGLTDQNLWFTQSGSDLVVTGLNSTDQFTLSNWFGSNAGAQVSTIKALGGGHVDAGDVGQLVTAMANYQTANPSFNPMSAAAMPTDATLQSAIQTYWHV